MTCATCEQAASHDWRRLVRKAYISWDMYTAFGSSGMAWTAANTCISGQVIKYSIQEIASYNMINAAA